MRRVNIISLILSFVIGFTGTFAFLPYEAQVVSRQQTTIEIPLDCLAWWGALYPQYGVSNARKLVKVKNFGTESLTPENKQQTSDIEKIPVKICFKYLTFLND